MTEEKFAKIIDKKIEQINSLRNLGHRSPEFKTWTTTCQELMAAAFGEESRQYKGFNDISYITWNMSSTPQQDMEAYNRGLESARAYLEAQKENVELYGLPESKSSGSKEQKSPLVQNFYLTQSQVQVVKNEIDLSSLEPEVAAKVGELLSELEKKNGKDKDRIGSIVKWLAERSVDVLIALITSSK